MLHSQESSTECSVEMRMDSVLSAGITTYPWGFYNTHDLQLLLVHRMTRLSAFSVWITH